MPASGLINKENRRKSGSPQQKDNVHLEESIDIAGRKEDAGELEPIQANTVQCDNQFMDLSSPSANNRVWTTDKEEEEKEPQQKEEEEAKTLLGKAPETKEEKSEPTE